MTRYPIPLPAAYVDLVELDAVADPRLRLLDCNPGADETDFPPGEVLGLPVLSFVLFDTAGPAVDDAEVSIHVNGVLVYDGGSWLEGWTGAVELPYPSAVRFLLTAPAPFGSLETVQVQVEAKTLDSAGTIDTTYAFQTEDVAGPEIAAVMVPSLTTVYVHFDEAVYLGTGTEFYSALNPANYTLAALTVPAAVVAVASVVELDAATVALTLDVELTADAVYRLSLLQITDLHLNRMGEPAAADLTAPPLDVAEERRFDLWRFIPEINRREDDPRNGGSGALRLFVTCLNEVTALLLRDVDHWTDILDPDFAAERYLDAMLLDMGNPFDFDLSEIDKRRLLRVLVQVYREKGTAPGIENVVLFFLGLTITVRNAIGFGKWTLGTSALGIDTVLGPSAEWDRRSFFLTSPIALTAEQRAQIWDLATYMKPAGTHIAALIEPAEPAPYDPVELGRSALGVDWILHAG